MLTVSGVTSRTTIEPQLRLEYDDDAEAYALVDENGNLTLVASGGVFTLAGELNLYEPLGIEYGGTGLYGYALGDTLYGSAPDTLGALPGNITATRKFLAQTGTGAVSAAPTWTQPAFSDLTGALTYAQLPTGGGTWANGGVLSITGGVTMVAGLNAPTITFPASPNTLTVYNSTPTALATWSGATGRLSLLFPLIVPSSIITPIVRQDTVASSDTGSLFLTSTSANDLTRGATFALYGDQHATQAGKFIFGAGNAAGANIQMWVNSAEVFRVGATSIGMVSGQKFYPDGVAMNGDTYFYESAANVWDFFAGGVNTLRLSATAVTIPTGLTGIIRADAGVLSVAAGVGVKTLFDHFADANNGTTVETDLYSDTIPAARLAANGEKLVAQYSLIVTGDATSTQRLRVYFGAGTLIFDSTAVTFGVTVASLNAFVTVMRVSSSVVRCSVALSTSFASLAAYVQYTEVTGLTLANTQVLKITGTAAGATGGSNQITAKESYVEWLPAAA